MMANNNKEKTGVASPADQQGKKRTVADWLGIAGIALSGFGQGVTNPEVGPYYTISALESMRKMRFPDPLDAIKKLEAIEDYKIWQKHKQGITLTDYERDKAGIKTDKPTTWDLYKQAEKESKTKHGGGLMGWNNNKQQAYENDIEEIYLNKLKRWGYENKDSRLLRAKIYLRKHGKLATDEMAIRFLKKYSNF